jgi:hypothetical protein
MSHSHDSEFERELLVRLLSVAQGAIDRVSLQFREGQLQEPDLGGILGRELDDRGINDLSAAWLSDAAARIAGGEDVSLPSAETLAARPPADRESA